METLNEIFDSPLWEILQVALIFVAKPMWDFLTTSGGVTVRLEQNRAQNSMVNYVITNHGKRKVNGVKVTFSRAPKERSELWTVNKGVSELSFGSLAPGERHVSMFTPGTARVEPIGVQVTYVNGPFFPRLGRYLLPACCRWRRKFSTTLDVNEFLEFRYNVGYEGKRELNDIVEAIKDLTKKPLEGVRARIEETTGNADEWVQRIPTGEQDAGGSAEERFVSLLPLVRRIERAREKSNEPTELVKELLVKLNLLNVFPTKNIDEKELTVLRNTMGKPELDTARTRFPRTE